MKHTNLVAAALAVLVVALSGCGGSGSKSAQTATTGPAVTTSKNAVSLDKQAYDRTMAQLGRQLAGSVESLFPLVEAQPGTAASKASLVKLERTRAVVSKVMTRVANIAPPAAIRTEHLQLLQGISALGGELDQLINVEEKGASKPFGQYARFLSLRTIDNARKAIEKKGYTIG